MSWTCATHDLVMGVLKLMPSSLRMGIYSCTCNLFIPFLLEKGEILEIKGPAGHDNNIFIFGLTKLMGYIVQCTCILRLQLLASCYIAQTTTVN